MLRLLYLERSQIALLKGIPVTQLQRIGARLIFLISRLAPILRRWATATHSKAQFVTARGILS